MLRSRLTKRNAFKFLLPLPLLLSPAAPPLSKAEIVHFPNFTLCSATQMTSPLSALICLSCCCCNLLSYICPDCILYCSFFPPCPLAHYLVRLLTDPIFLDRIPDPDPFEKLDLIPHSDPLAFSGSAIRSDLPIHLGFKAPSMCFLFA
jgi:hypothetical protein